jgi:hypothetical protein
VGAMKNSDFFSQEDGVMFCIGVCSVMEVLDHEFNQIIGACSLIHQK